MLKFTFKDSDALNAVHLFFNNRFDEAQHLCEPKLSSDALYALVSSAVKFFKALLTFDDADFKFAIAELDKTYDLAQADINLACPSAGMLGSMSKLWSSGLGLFSNSNTSDQPTQDSKDLEQSNLSAKENDKMHNVEFRARILRSESLLLNALMHFFQESIVSYVKAGFNLRKGYLDYQCVHSELKKVVASDQIQSFDKNSVSGVYFG